MTLAETAAYLRTPVATLRYWRHLGEGPASFRLGRRVVYRREDVDRWIGERQRSDASSGVEPSVYVGQAFCTSQRLTWRSPWRAFRTGGAARTRSRAGWCQQPRTGKACATDLSSAIRRDVRWRSPSP